MIIIIMYTLTKSCYNVLTTSNTQYNYQQLHNTTNSRPYGHSTNKHDCKQLMMHY